MDDWDSVFDETYLLTYLPFVDEERTRAEALGAAALAGLEAGADVLDCPCGFARHALVLADAGYRVTGLDRSETLLAEAERRRGDAEWPLLVRGDYRELPFDDASFDAVVAGELFEHLQFPDALVAEIQRVLRPGGALVGSVPNAFRVQSRLLFLRGKPPEDDPTHLRMFSPDAMRVLLRDFEDVRIDFVGGRYARLSARLFARDLVFRAEKRP